MKNSFSKWKMDLPILMDEYLFSDIFYTQKCVNKKTGKKSFSPHKLWEKNYRQKSRIAFLMKSFLAQINCSHSYMMCH